MAMSAESHRGGRGVQASLRALVSDEKSEER